MNLKSQEKNSRIGRKDLSATRLFAVQALFQMEASNTSLTDVQEEFTKFRMGSTINGSVYASGDKKLFESLTLSAVKNQRKIDKLTNLVLKDSWPLSRIDPTLRALFRVATAELIDKKAPPKVIINEFLEIAKAFFPEGKEPKLVNGVLDKIAEKIY